MNNENLENLYYEFEQNLREEICNAANALHQSGMSFAVFANTRCNEDYWNRAGNGGWNMKQNVKPSEAVNDIFDNGWRYSTECATAMEIVYYKAILEVYGDELFDKTFTTIYLMDWDIRDPLLRKVGRMEDVGSEGLLIGDRAYFANPDHAPDLPQWQGENVIVLEDGLYYGHGIGLNTAENIIKSLNSRRKSGDVQSAYLMNKAGRPDFRKLADVMNSPTAVAVWRHFPPAVLTKGIEAKNGFRHIPGERLFV
ncbi:MAG: protein-glutamine gamma-glutamyltransferase [Oscillospiraceae bacterium]|nr:protein-glutamine gamma-glutamyltransferase [Oscillospiraceae bacterium]